MIDSRILRFIRRHHVLCLATSRGGRSWVAHAFYAWSEDAGGFVFSSSGDTRHGAEMVDNQYVAAGIALETRVVGRLQGLQIEGTVRRVSDDDQQHRKAYLKRFPYAFAAAGLQLWVLEPTQMKLTDNALGFGKKLVWVRA